MYVCICRAVTAATIRQEIADGARTVDDVARRCGAGGDCGACREEIADLIDEHRLARGAAPVAWPLVAALKAAG